MSDGEALDGEIITKPAALSSSEAAAPAPEHDVPMTPTTCSSGLTAWAAALPPFGVHMELTGRPVSTR